MFSENVSKSTLFARNFKLRLHQTIKRVLMVIIIMMKKLSIFSDVFSEELASTTSVLLPATTYCVSKSTEATHIKCHAQ